jgi:hypothetical protein
MGPEHMYAIRQIEKNLRYNAKLCVNCTFKTFSPIASSKTGDGPRTDAVRQNVKIFRSDAKVCLNCTTDTLHNILLIHFQNFIT